MRRRAAALGVLVLAAGVAGPVAGAAAADSARFIGSCTLHGTDGFAPPLTVRPSAGTATARAAGTCSGSLLADGKVVTVRSAAATYAAMATSTGLSCAGGLGTGAGTLTIGGLPFPFRLQEPQLTVVSVLSLAGLYGGSAIGVASVVGASPTDLLTLCLTTGITAVPIALAITANLTS